MSVVCFRRFQHKKCETNKDVYLHFFDFHKQILKGYTESKNADSYGSYFILFYFIFGEGMEGMEKEKMEESFQKFACVYIFLMYFYSIK